jgi:phosphinothricin tripeptide acetyl hydrolase
MSHPGVEAIAGYLAESAFTRGTIPEQRAAMDQVASTSKPPVGMTVRSDRLGGRDAEWLEAADGAPDAVVLYLHGGGYCIGSLATHRPLAGRMAQACGCQVVTLDYRLAPEHPFPAAVEDACAAYGQILANGTAPDRMAVAGDSAGGGLAIALLLALRSAGTPLPAALVCLSPWTDLTQSAPAYDDRADLDPMVTRAGLDEMAAAYLGDTDPRTELASPLFGDLDGLPPARIEVGENEVLFDDATGMADRLRSAGVDVSLVVWPDLIHVFQAFPGELIPEADSSIDGVGAFVRGHLGLPPATVRGQGLR